MAKHLTVVSTTAAGDSNVIAEWSETLDDNFILCRDFGHNWRPFQASLTPEGTYDRVLRCNRCKTRRTQELSARGESLRSGYDYPDGYQAPAGTGRMGVDARSALRLESTLRLIRKPKRG